MRAVWTAVIATGLSSFIWVATGAAQPQQRLTSCRVGQRVVLPGGGMGTVISLTPNKACNVQADGYKDYQAWSAWMLAPAPGTAAATVAPKPAGGGTPRTGNYQCFGGAAGNMKLRFGPGASYANEQGKTGAYKMRPSGQMEFVSGPWAGFYAKTLGDGRVGLTSRADSTFYQMTCDPR